MDMTYRFEVAFDQDAGEAGKMIILCPTLRAAPDGDHFADAGKMVFHCISRGFARSYSALNSLLEAFAKCDGTEDGSNLVPLIERIAQ